MPPQSNNPDKELAEFFTDVEYMRDMFKNFVATQTLPKRILVIHGVGGVGKSSLLQMFRLHCKSVNVPVALASGDESKYALDVLACWTDDLKVDGIPFASFDKMFERHRAIQEKVDERAKKSQDARGRAADIAGKAASKTAEAAGGALAGAAIGSVIPGIGTAIGGALGGALGGMGAEALVDWLRGFLTKPDIDLLLDPAKKLTDDFLDDVSRAADKRRIVLMLDTFEQMTAFNDWARDVAQRLHVNALLIIAGRSLPNWDRSWQGWMANAQVEELKPMTEEVMRDLVRRYYAMMRGGNPDPTQVESIIHFARGLPIVVTSAVQLWVKYGVEDFQSVKAEIVANLVDRLMEGVPSTLIPALEAAAIVRWFDQPILRAVAGFADVRDAYNDLRRFPFVRTRTEGFALHDAVREIMDENLRAHDSERHCELHERAAVYFEKRLEKATGDEAERLGLERLYHLILAEEEVGIKMFQEIAEELVRYRLVNGLRALLNDANTYPLERENSKLWHQYYNARLAHVEMRFDEASESYKAISNNKQAEPRLRAYALTDLGQTMLRRKFFADLLNKEVANEIINLVESSIQGITPDGKLVSGLGTLQAVYHFMGNKEKVLATIKRQLQYYQEHNLNWVLLDAYDSLRWYYACIGRFGDMLKAHRELCKIALPLLSYPSVRKMVATSVLTWIGRYAEVDKGIRDVLDSISDRYALEFVSQLHVDLAYVLGLQGKYREAHELFEEGLKTRETLGDRYFLAYWKAFQGIIYIREGNLSKAEASLKWSQETRKNLNDKNDILTPAFLGMLYETREDFDSAVEHYQEAIDRATDQLYFKSIPLIGLIRINHARGHYSNARSLLAVVDQHSKQYEYNDHLASLRLTQAHVAWDGKLPEWGSGFDDALRYYQHALIYALRYNRFMLDEVLWGGNVATPLRPIIPHLLERGDEGRRILVVLRDWWCTGKNDIGTPRPDTISPIHEGVPLLEAERIAREREPGDGLPQKSVVEQIEAVL